MRSATPATPLFLVGLLAISLSSLAFAADRSPDQRFEVVGYLPEYRLGGFNYEAAFESGLTYLLFFSLEISARGEPSALDRLPSKEDARDARRAADKVGGKILISFGGNARSQNFGEMATSVTKRQVFLGKLEKLMLEYGFDGVDYNWEYPRNHHEWSAWGDLMQETKKLLAGKCIVTFTMYLDPRHYDVIMHYDLLSKADFVHCMAYDQRGEHSTVSFFESGISLAIEKGFERSKLTMGVPFYARHTHNGEPKTYYEIADKLDDEITDEYQSYYFNSRETLKKKTKLAVDAGLGGIMIWELGQDLQPLSNPRSLMTAVHAGLPKSLKTKTDEL